jgi:hypothetical protein
VLKKRPGEASKAVRSAGGGSGWTANRYVASSELTSADDVDDRVRERMLEAEKRCDAFYEKMVAEGKIKGSV